MRCRTKQAPPLCVRKAFFDTQKKPSTLTDDGNGGAVRTGGTSLSHVLQGKADTESRIRSRRQLFGLSVVLRPQRQRWSDAFRGAAVKSKGPAIPKDLGKYGDKLVTPACATHTPDNEIVEHKVVVTQTLIPTTDAEPSQQWRAFQSSHQLELQTLQHKISRILQDAASGYAPRGSAARSIPHRLDNPGYERRQSQLQQRDFQPSDETLDLRGPPVAVLLRDIGQTLNVNRRWLSRHFRHASHRRETVKSAIPRKNGRDQQEGQFVATSHGGAMSRWPETV